MLQISIAPWTSETWSNLKILNFFLKKKKQVKAITKHKNKK